MMMTEIRRVLFFLLLVFGYVQCDVYMHNPRGSNNRLNESLATRKNNNRMFDSQNNARGGYNVGDKGNKKSNTEEEQYNMKYFYATAAGGQSEIPIEWTNQHGCGGNDKTDPHKQNCEIVIQYMCQPSDSNGPRPSNLDRLRNGQSTDTQVYQSNNKAGSVKLDRGLHEPYEWYDRCRVRERNKGLFTADQILRSNTARFTRQNPGGGQSGYECPEERDYYPYWHPNPWRDIAILVDDDTRCAYYRTESFNVRPRGECVGADGSRRVSSNTAAACQAKGGQWTEFHQYLEKIPGRTEANCKGAVSGGTQLKWAIPWDAAKPQKECLVTLPSPVCQSAPWTRSNHLGDARGAKTNSRFTWKLPHFPSGRTHRCVLRIRYNISTDDYAPWSTNASYNGLKSPVRQNPLVPVGVGRSPLRLAINTAQFGRTFQDRSHVLLLAPRPGSVSQSARLVNLNVRGKRGNIVQVYPAVEYDFVPNRLSITRADLVHLQWTGSNTHNNGNPGGDGQVGDDGQGTGGTDRHNFVQAESPDVNFPTPVEAASMWRPDAMEVVWAAAGLPAGMDATDFAVHAASAGYYQCMAASKCSAQSVEKKAKMNPLLNNAPASFAGIIFRMKKAGTYYYLSTRNNNFSNRSQKGHLIVV